MTSARKAATWTASAVTAGSVGGTTLPCARDVCGRLADCTPTLSALRGRLLLRARLPWRDRSGGTGALGVETPTGGTEAIMGAAPAREWLPRGGRGVTAPDKTRGEAKG